MNPERWRQVEQVYHAALERAASQRAAFLAQACHGDEDLRREVESLLAHDDSASGGPLDQPAWEGRASLLDESTPPELAAGTELGPYRIEALLGRGGMGVVYRARDTKLNRPVAIKLLSKDLSDAAARRRFQREAQMASSLNHPHILTVHDAGEFDGRQYLITEFVDGGTLNDWARAERRTWLQAVELLAGVADGLAAAHSAGILHRDIKPANVLVAKNGYAKLADFGLARLAEPQRAASTALTEGPTKTGMILGTIPYMSPEQTSGQPLDSRSDIFSFGVMIYEALAGRRPFTGAIDLEVLESIRHGIPQPLGDEIPIALRMTVEKALEKDPGDRYQSMRDLLVDLKRAQRPGTDEMRRNQGTAMPRQRHWRMAASIAAVIVLGMLAVAWRLWESEYFWQNPLAGARTERLTDFEGDEMDAAISPDGKLAFFLSDRDGPFDAWVSQIGSGEFVNVTKGSVPLPRLGLIPRVGFSRDGAQVWLTEGTTPRRYETTLGPAIGGTLRPFLKGLNPAWSPDGSRIVYHTPEDGDPIFVADRNGRNPRKIFEVKPGVHCHYLTWSLDGRHVYFVKGFPTTEEMDVWRIAVPASGATSDSERITNHNALVTHPAWLDERTLIYSVTAEDGSGQSLYTVDVERRIPRRVSSGITEKYLSVAVSATRPLRLIATVATPRADLWTVPVADQVQSEAAVKRFPVPNTRALGPRFAANDLLFLSSKDGRDGLWLLQKGQARELWKGSEGGIVAPAAISPDGRELCFSYRKQGRAGLYLMNLDGTNVRTVAESFDVRGAASWSPDGKWIAVAANEGEGMRVVKIPVNGGPPIRLLDTLSFHPAWSPDGQMIVYCEQRGGGQFTVRAITPDKVPLRIPNIEVGYTTAIPYHFVPNRKSLIYLRPGNLPEQDFYVVDLENGQQRQLTKLNPGSAIQSFDVAADGKQIVFDRVRRNADIVIMDLTR